MKAMIDAGAAGVHFEDQLASEKKCGHMGGKVLVPNEPVHPHAHRRAPRRRRRRRADGPRRPHRRRQPRSSSPSDVDERDRPFITGERTAEGFLPHPGGLDRPSPAASPTPSTPTCLVRDVEAGPRGGQGLRRGRPREVPGKMLAYNCSPSFNWKKNLDDARSRSSSASSGGWATGSSSSPSPASTR
jgi:isocitrate lyase